MLLWLVFYHMSAMIHIILLFVPSFSPQSCFLCFTTGDNIVPFSVRIAAPLCAIKPFVQHHQSTQKMSAREVWCKMQGKCRGIRGCSYFWQHMFTFGLQFIVKQRQKVQRVIVDPSVQIDVNYTLHHTLKDALHFSTIFMCVCSKVNVVTFLCATICVTAQQYVTTKGKV